MAVWRVSDSETEETAPELSFEPRPNHEISFSLDSIFGEKINTKKMVDLMHRISENRSLELDCTSEYLEERRRKKKRKRKKRDSFPDGEISETTSELVSTRTPSTGTATTSCRDTRRPSLSAFDYEHEEFPALGGSLLLPGRKRKPRPSKKTEPQAVPALAAIEASLRYEELEHNRTSTINDEDTICNGNHHNSNCSNQGSSVKGPDWQHSSTSISPLFVPSSSWPQSDKETSLRKNGFNTTSFNTKDGTFNFSFDDDDDNLDSSFGQDGSIFSKIRKIETFLDQEDH